jgi:hypothetical protein
MELLKSHLFEMTLKKQNFRNLILLQVLAKRWCVIKNELLL